MVRLPAPLSVILGAAAAEEDEQLAAVRNHGRAEGGTQRTRANALKLCMKCLHSTETRTRIAPGCCSGWALISLEGLRAGSHCVATWRACLVFARVCLFTNFVRWKPPPNTTVKAPSWAAFSHSALPPRRELLPLRSCL